MRILVFMGKCFGISNRRNLADWAEKRMEKQHSNSRKILFWNGWVVVGTGVLLVGVVFDPVIQKLEDRIVVLLASLFCFIGGYWAIRRSRKTGKPAYLSKFEMELDKFRQETPDDKNIDDS